MEDSNIRIGPYLVVEEIGHGAHGRVCRGEHSGRGGVVAIKTMKESHASRSGCNVSNEVLLLKNTSHKNVVQFLDHIVQGDQVHIVMEFVPLRLTDKLKDGGCEESLARRYVGDIMSALEYLHGRGIRQGDVKPENCLITLEGVLKLTDFGISVLAEKKKESGTCLGTPNYMAPELFKGGACFASDIWATGCTMIHLRTGHAPYHTLNRFAVQRIQAEGQPPPLYDHASTLEREFLSRTFVQDPTVRPSATELLTHAWLDGYQTDRRRDRRRDTIWASGAADGSPAAAAAADADAFMQNRSMATMTPADFKKFGVGNGSRMVAALSVQPQAAAAARRPSPASKLPVAAALAAASSPPPAVTSKRTDAVGDQPSGLAGASVISAAQAVQAAVGQADQRPGSLAGALVVDQEFPEDADVKRSVVVSLSQQPGTDSDGKARFASIGAAIQTVASGTAIFVEPGDYMESLEFNEDKILYVRGLGASGSVRIRGDPAKARCAFVQQGTVWFDRMAFKLMDSGKGRIDEVVRVMGDGRLNMRDCLVTGGSGIYASGPKAAVKLEACTVNNAKTGVSVHQGAQARVLFSQVFGNRLGLRAQAAGVLEIKSSKFWNNTEHGCLVDGPRTELTVEQTTFSDNRRGLECGDGATLKLVTSHFSDNVAGALIVRGHSAGQVKHCHFSGNQNVSVELAGGESSPTFSENTFEHTKIGCLVRAAAPSAGSGSTSGRSSSSRKLSILPCDDILNPTVFLENVFKETVVCGFVVYASPQSSKAETFAKTIQSNNIWNDIQSNSSIDKVKVLDADLEAGLGRRAPPRTPMAKMKRGFSKTASKINSAMKKKTTRTSNDKDTEKMGRVGGMLTRHGRSARTAAQAAPAPPSLFSRRSAGADSAAAGPVKRASTRNSPVVAKSPRKQLLRTKRQLELPTRSESKTSIREDEEEENTGSTQTMSPCKRARISAQRFADFPRARAGGGVEHLFDEEVDIPSPFGTPGKIY